MKHLFFHELNQNVTREFSKKYFHSEKEEKGIFFKYCCPWKSFLALAHQYL